MDLLGLAVAAGVPLIGTVVVARTAGRRVERYFTALVGKRGTLRRQPPILKMGLGLDDVTYSTFDFGPGLVALVEPVDDPDLEPLRKNAAIHAGLYVLWFFAGLVLAAYLANLLEVDPAIPTGVVFFAWFMSQYVVLRHALWASRPEIREIQEMGAQTSLVLAEVVVGALAFAGLVVFVVLQLRG